MELKNSEKDITEYSIWKIVESIKYKVGEFGKYNEKTGQTH